MKIERLYTLSQFIDLIENDESLNYEDQSVLIFTYNDFLKQPLNKEMFVNDIKKPIEESSLCVGGDRDQRWLKWYEAEKKVIFEGFSKRMWDGGVLFDNDLLDIFIDISEHKTLSHLADATNGELKLKNIEL